MRRSNDAAIKVPDLSTAEVFYRDISGLQFGLRDQKRNWLFLRISGSAGIVVLQEDRSKWPRQHFAFAIKDAELERAAALLKEKGISIEGPVFYDWMPGRSVYFADPDGHDLELFALTDHEESRLAKSPLFRRKPSQRGKSGGGSSPSNPQSSNGARFAR